jgi:pyruvate kinase
MKRTKIVCTIGPASEKQATIEKMMKAGMNVCRLNMSHGTYAWHARAIRTIRKAAKKVGAPVAILLDLQGPKVRLGEVSGVRGQVSVGDRVVFTTNRKGLSLRSKDSPLGVKIPIAVPHFEKYVKNGAHLLIADGTMECVVEKVVGQDIYAHVTLGGELKSNKGIAIQGVSLPLPSLTAKDKKDVAWGFFEGFKKSV